MYLVEFENQEITKTPVNVSLLTHKASELQENAVFDFIKNHEQTAHFLKTAVLFDELENFNQECHTVILTADNSSNDIEKLVNDFGFYDIIFFVQDFKDGRTFSLIRYLRNLSFFGSIYLLGNYGLDQAGYYFKSGATGFFVKDEQLDTLLKTLDDLKSGHFGQSAKALPMFQ
ncbi:MAG: DUF934 domain-containing protein [Moraxella sp.]|uniref:DUF934 domain-containing protein n=1 Tax=Moraxella sp. TaxID=479 RepID=UPI0026DB7D4C|nr:DUF934 domain-containing protein [Moraxella sp.]MDO4450774.1 DUF934 domain-containing protein [Moraxella sp.]